MGMSIFTPGLVMEEIILEISNTNQ
jgi:hypothetical protein